MLWLVLALSTALFESLKNVTSKYGLQQLESRVVACGNSTATALLLLPVVAAWAWWNPEARTLILHPPERFWWAVLLSGLLNTANYLLFMSALKEGEISKVLPLISFSPAIMLITSPFILGEMPNALGLVGVLTIVLGAYVLNAGGMNRNLWAPLKGLFRESASRKMLAVAFIASISAQVDKVGILAGDPLAYACIINLLIGLITATLMFATVPGCAGQLRQGAKPILGAAIFNTLTIVPQVFALQLAYATYVIAIKRLSSLFNVVLGYSLFGERQMGFRLTGAAIMLVGVLAIVFS